MTAVGAPPLTFFYGPAEEPAGTTRPPARCRCGHDEAAHRHFRPGTDCGACGNECVRYAPENAASRRLRRALRRLGGAA